MGRKLSPEEAAALGLPAQRRKLSAEEARALGLVQPGDPGFDWAASAAEGEKARAAKGESLASVRAGEKDLPLETSAEPRKMSLPRAVGHRFLNAQTQGWSDEAVGSLTNLLMPLKGNLEGRRYLRPDGTSIPVEDTEGVRRAARDWERKDIKESMATLGKADLPVAVVGDLIGQAALPKALTTGLGGALRLGGVNGLGNSEAELKDGQVAGAVADTAIGAGASGLGYGVGKGLGWVADKTVAPVLRRLGIGQARRAITGGANTLETKKGMDDETVRTVLDAGGIQAGDSTRNIADRIAGMSEQTRQTYVNILKYLDGMGVKGPDATALGLKMLDQSTEEVGTTLGSSVPGFWNKVGNEMGDKAGGNELNLLQAEAIKRNLQKEARNEYSRLNGNTDIGDAKMDLASMVRQAIEDEVAKAGAAAPADSTLRQVAEQFVPAKKRLGAFIQAEMAATKGAEQAAKRRFISPSTNMMIAASLANGNPAALAAPVANQILLNRGTSTAAVGLYGLGNYLGNAPLGSEVGRGLTPYILKLLRGEGESQP